MNLSVAASSTTAPDRLAQQLLYHRWIVLVFAQIEPRAREIHGVTTYGMPFEDEAADAIRIGHRYQPASFFFKSSLSCAGLALPPVAFIDLADEEAEQLVLARAVIGELPRILRHHIVDGLLDRAGIGDLLEALGLDDGVGVLALGPHGLEHVLGDLSRDGVVGDAAEQSREARRVDAALADLQVVFIERRRERARHPVGGELGLILRGLLAARQ